MTIRDMPPTHAALAHSMPPAVPCVTPRVPVSRLSRLYEVMDLMLDSVGDPLALGSLAASASYSSYHFDRIFRELTGFSAVEYQRKRRLRRAAHLLRHEPDVAGRAHCAGLRFSVQRGIRQGLSPAVRHAGQILARRRLARLYGCPGRARKRCQFLCRRAGRTHRAERPLLRARAGQRRRARHAAPVTGRAAALPALLRPVRRGAVAGLQCLYLRTGKRRHPTRRAVVRRVRRRSGIYGRARILLRLRLRRRRAGRPWAWACACCRPGWWQSSSFTASGRAFGRCTKTGSNTRAYGGSMQRGPMSRRSRAPTMAGGRAGWPCQSSGASCSPPRYQAPRCA